MIGCDTEAEPRDPCDEVRNETLDTLHDPVVERQFDPRFGQTFQSTV